MNPTLPAPETTRRHGLGRIGVLLALAAWTSPAFAQSAPASSTPVSDEVVTLSPFSVSTDKDYGYRASNSIAGTRSNTPIKDVPLNIQVSTKDLVDDLQITNQVDLERYNAALVNGSADVYSDNPIQQAYNAFLFRGFVQNWGLRDGIREYDPIDTQGLSRVEIVKGPAAALYGLAYPGGVMNNITKDVDFTKSFTSVRATIQSEGEYRGTVDANYTAKLGQGRFGVRYNGAYADTKDIRDHSDGAVHYSQIGLAWSPWASTEVKLLAERGLREKPNGLGYFTRAGTDGALIPLQADHPDIPWTWNWATGTNLRSIETQLYRATINQAVGEHLNITAYAQYASRDNIDSNGWEASGSGGAASWDLGDTVATGWINSDTPSTSDDFIRLAYHYRDWTNRMHAYGATAVYKLNVGPVKNTLTFGTNIWTERFLSRRGGQPSTTTNVLEFPVLAGIDTTTVPIAPPSDYSFTTASGGFQHENNSNDYYFASWQAYAFEDRLKLNLAINRTNLKLVQWSSGVATVPNLTEQSKNSPMIGGMFDITKEISVFAVHSTSLFPTTDKDSFSVQMPPVTGTSYEGGVKVELLDGKVSGTLSYYQIKQKGGSQRDPSAENLNKQRWDAMTPAERTVAFPGITDRANVTDGNGVSGQLGDLVPGAEQESKGFEADLIFQPIRSWQLLFSYAHNTQEVTSATNAATIGQSTSGHVKDQFSVLTKYTFIDGSLKGLSLGVGMQYAGKALQDYQGTLARYNPSTSYLEAFAGYRVKLLGYNTVFQLNAKNLTEQDDFVGWKPSGTAGVTATERYKVPTKMRIALTVGIDF
jgi:iron complex outermembrane recepter protein